MSRIFVSHSGDDTREAVALKIWLTEQRPDLAEEIFVAVDDHSGLRLGEQSRTQLFTGNSRCEFVICLLSPSWLDSAECYVEYRTADGLGKRILVARLDGVGGQDEETISAWQRYDLCADGAQTEIDVPDGPPVRFNSAALNKINHAIPDAAGGPRQFAWPPSADPERAPYRGWEPFEDVDAGVFFGRDAAIGRGLDVLRGMRFRLLAGMSGLKSAFVVLGPSGVGKSSFLRAGLIPRLQRDDRNFTVLGVVHPRANVLTGDSGLAAAIHAARETLNLSGSPLAQIKEACSTQHVDKIVELLNGIRDASAKQLVRGSDGVASAAEPSGMAEPVEADTQAVAPTLILPIDQAEELFCEGAPAQTDEFLTLLAELIRRINTDEVGLILAATIRTDRYDATQSHPALENIGSALFDDLRPMSHAELEEVIVGPAARATATDNLPVIADDLLARMLSDAGEGTGEGADILPLLALTLSRLYADYDETGHIHLADYEAVGGMAEAVNNEIEMVLRVYPGDRDSALTQLRSAFVPWLTSTNSAVGSDQPRRRVALESDLPWESRPLIDALVARGLLVRFEGEVERQGEVVVQVASETLLRQSDYLASWLAEERANFTAAEDIERSAAAWENQHCDPNLLFTGSRLLEAEKLSESAGFSVLLAGCGRYLRACREAERQRLHDEEALRNKKLREAQEVARQARERQLSAESRAGLTRERFRILIVIAVIAIVGAVSAIYGVSSADHARHQADEQTREAIALRLTSEARAMLAGGQEGGDIRALQEVLAAPHVASTADTGALFDGLVLRWNTLKMMQGPKLQSLAVSPDGRRLVTGQVDGALQLWDPQTGQRVGAPLTGHQGDVGAVVFTPDGHRVVSAGDDKTVRVWNADTGEPIGAPMVGHTNWVTSLAISPDGHRIVSGSNDHTMRLWNADTGQPIGSPIVASPQWVDTVAFSPDGHRIVSGSDDCTLKLWNADTGQQVGASLIGHTDWVEGVAFSPDGRRIVSGSYDKTLRIWDAGTGAPVGKPLIGHNGPIGSVAYSPDGRHIISGGEDDTVRIWDADSGQEVGDPLVGHTAWVTRVAYSPDGRRIISGSNDGMVRVWSTDIDVIAGHVGNVTSAQFGSDGSWIVSGSDDKTVRIWDTAKATHIGDPMTGHTEGVTSVAISPDVHRIASASKDKTVRLWDVASRRPIGEPLTGHTEVVTSVGFSPDGRLVVSGSKDKTVRLWDAATRKPVGQPMVGHRDSVTAVVFSPDGHLVASASADKTILLWDVASGKTVGQPLIGHTEDVTSLAFTPDGRELVSGSKDETVRTWDVASGLPIGRPMKGHTGTVTGVAVSANGSHIISSSTDKSLRMWDADTGKPIGQPMTGHTEGVNSVAFSADGQAVVSTSDDDKLRLWPAPPQAQWVNILCDKLSANMTVEQWNDWVNRNVSYTKVCPNLPDAA